MQTKGNHQEKQPYFEIFGIHFVIFHFQYCLPYKHEISRICTSFFRLY